MPAMHTVTPRPALGMACVLAAAALWGTTGTSQALAGGQLPALWFGAGRLVFASVFFLLFAAASGGLARQAWQGMTWREALAAGGCMAVYNLAFFAGVRLTGVGVGTAIALGSGPIWAGLLQAVVQRQPPSRAWWWGTAVAVAGGVLLTWGPASGGASVGATPGLAAGAVPTVSWAGIGLCLAAGLSYAVYTVLNKRLVGRVPASTITLAAFGSAALVALPAAAWQAGWPSPGVRDLAALAFTGMVSAGVAYLLYSHAMHHIKPATGVSLALTEPVVAFGLAVLLLHEPASLASVAGIGLVLAGVLGVVRAELAGAARPQA